MPDSACVACGGRLDSVLDLGAVPLVDALAENRQSAIDAQRFPLEVMRCTNCAWVQLDSAPPPQRLFDDGYRYFSSVSEGVTRSAQDHAEALIQQLPLSDSNQVVEIASNDGYQLRWFKRQGVKVLGIEPASGPASAARRLGIETVEAFFDLKVAEQLRRRGVRADLVLAKNVLAHVPDPGDFLRGVALLLAEDGVASLEFPYLEHLLDGVQFDTIYHEHRSYLAITPLDRLLRKCGLGIARIQQLALHGGSLRVDLVRTPGCQSDRDRFLQAEQESGLLEPETLDRFSMAVAERVAALRSTIAELSNQHCRLAAYGAAAKGVALLTACGLDDQHIQFVVDRSPAKIGLYLPGSGLEIREPEALMTERPDVVLLLAWNFVDEIRAQQQHFERAGGRWLIPDTPPRMVAD